MCFILSIQPPPTHHHLMFISSPHGTYLRFRHTEPFPVLKLRTFCSLHIAVLGIHVYNTFLYISICVCVFFRYSSSCSPCASYVVWHVACGRVWLATTSKFSYPGSTSYLASNTPELYRLLHSSSSPTSSFSTLWYPSHSTSGVHRSCLIFGVWFVLTTFISFLGPMILFSSTSGLNDPSKLEIKLH